MVHSLLRELASSRRWKFFEIRGGKVLDERAVPSITFYGHTLDLRGGPEALFAGFDSSVRRAIRKAQRSTIASKPLEESVRSFTTSTPAHAGGTGSAATLFIFLNITTPHSSVSCCGASPRERPVAGALFFHKGNRAVYKFGASDERFQHLRPNNLVFWESISFLARQGVEDLHLGRTSIGNEGLRRFKLSWGTTEQTIRYFRFDSQTNDWTTVRDNASGFHNAAFARFPLALNRLMGALIYQHLD
jgi:hypothetical protein